jgi:hypothetical protein
MSTNAISPANQSASPDELIDRLFVRLSAAYGEHLARLWADVPLAEVKASWARALARYEPKAIGRALEHCEQHVKFAPTLPEFCTLCRELRPFPNSRPVLLSGPREPMPPHIAAQLAEFRRKHVVSREGQS